VRLFFEIDFTDLFLLNAIFAPYSCVFDESFYHKITRKSRWLVEKNFMPEPLACKKLKAAPLTTEHKKHLWQEGLLFNFIVI